VFRLARKSDDDLILSVFRTEKDALFRSAYRRLASAEDAEDAVQDAFFRATRARKSVTELDNPRAWVFRILHNLCTDRIRSRGRSPVTDEPDLSHLSDLHLNPGVEDRMIAAETLSTITKTMANLPPHQAEVLGMIVMDELSYADVASILNVPVGTVRSRLNRARQTLRDGLTEKSSETAPVTQLRTCYE
jgi:RNA polymerase sigma-70 factor (ECF subfamily)